MLNLNGYSKRKQQQRKYVYSVIYIYFCSKNPSAIRQYKEMNKTLFFINNTQKNNDGFIKYVIDGYENRYQDTFESH